MITMNRRSTLNRIVRSNFAPSLFLFGLVLLVAGCGNSEPSTVATPSTPSETTIAPEPSDSPAIPPNGNSSESAANTTLISTRGIGAAQLGMTLGELKNTLGPNAEFTVESPFITDFDAIAVRRNGEDAVAYYVLYLAGETLTDEDVIQGLLTDHPNFETAEGVGPGTAIVEAEEAYGAASLSYNVLNESREYARFERQPANNISFSTGNGNQNPAGIYAEPLGEYNETDNFREDATIQSVLVICLSEVCAPPTSN
jgi:hypothetical protein